MSRAARGLAASAALVAVLTLGARVVGFGRWFVFAGTVGSGCTGSAYAAANQLPNVLFEVAAGGALAGAVVPVLSGQLAGGREADADRTASALLTWAVVLGVPLSATLALLAHPLSAMLLDGRTVVDCGPGIVDLAARMLLVFSPQVALYAIGIVLTGVLQARHAFAGPAVAPLLSSLVVVVAYLVFGVVASGPDGAPGGRGELVLSAGTTLGVVALSLPLLTPAARAGVRLRPSLRFPAGTLPQLRSLAQAGAVALLAQQVAVLVTIALANRVGGRGVQPVVQYVQALYLLPYAVLALPVATAAFPRLAASAAAGRGEEYARTTAATTRSVVRLSLLGTAMLIATSPAVQALFVALDVARSTAVTALGAGLVAAAVGLVGWGLVAHLSRALYALGAARSVGGSTAVGWAVAVAVSVPGVLGLHAAGVSGERAGVIGLSAGTAAGMLVAAALLAAAVRRHAGAAALAGVRRALAVGAVGAVAAAAAGQAALFAVGASGVGSGPEQGAGAVVRAVAVGGVAALVAVVVFAMVVLGAEPGPGPAPRTGPRVALVLASSAGGVGRHVAALASWLVAQGASVRVASGADAADAFGLADTGASLDRVEIAGRPRPVADLRAALALRAIAGAVDVVHAHGLRAGALTVLAARSRRQRARVVVTLHNAPVGGGRVAAVTGVLLRVVARGADEVLVVSADLGDAARRLGARRVERALVPAPLRPAPLRPAPLRPVSVRAALGVAPGERLLVTVARLAPQKGLPMLLEAVRLLCADGVGPIRAVIAGDGPLHDVLAAEIAARSLPVTLLGRRDDVPDLLEAADVVVVPSVWEGQPLVVSEAIRAGAAIVATDVGGTGETAGDGAVLVPSDDAAALASAVGALLDDESALAAARERARRRAPELPTDEDAGRQMLAIYERLSRPGP